MVFMIIIVVRRRNFHLAVVEHNFNTLAVLKANFSFRNAKALFPSFLRDRDFFLKKKKRKKDEKPTSQLIPATKKEDLSFLVRFQFIKAEPHWQMCFPFIKLTSICLGLSASRYSRCDRNTFYNCNDKQAKSCDRVTVSNPL